MRKEIKDYYDATKYNLDGNIDLTDESDWPLSWKKIFYKKYPRFPSLKIKIPAEEFNLEDIIMKRESVRDYLNKPIDFETISKLLFYSVGIKKNFKDDLDCAKRMYPSAGARYPIETYFIANNITGLDKGLYHFCVKSDEIECLLRENLLDVMKTIVDPNLCNAPLIIILSGELSRTEVKYGTNAYRFALLEAGHICQNLYLLSENYGLGCCEIGGFDNDKLVELLDITEDELPLCLFTMGWKNG